MRRSIVLILALVVVLALGFDGGTSRAESPRAGIPIHHLEHGFRNVDPAYAYPIVERAKRVLRRTIEGWPDRGTPLVVVNNDGAELRANHRSPTITWIGHSTFLIQIDGLNVLTDPIWSDRASPVPFVGPRRLVRPGVRFENLPHIDAVVISHDHYDHLDEATVRRLETAFHPRFFVPLGFTPLLRDFGVKDIVELDWWQSAALRTVRFTATPAQHSSGRGLRDQNLRLWSSWVIATPNRRLFFGGDSGYFSGFKDIGTKLGPFQVALLPIGGYAGWGAHHPNHLCPEEAVQALEDLRADLLVPMHWGTFDMNREPFHEPPDRLLKEAVRRGLDEHIALLNPGQEISW